MRPTLKKLEIKDIGDLERLVAENVEGIEPGLQVIDSRLLLGQAAIDLVGLDARGSLVLIALDFTADESLLLRVMDAYSWCLEYPDAIQRLYPMAQAATNRPPRILFIVERLTDSFARRIKALSFLEIDCLEFRHLEVNGASALYFDLVQRLRRADAAASTVVIESAPPAPQLRGAPSPRTQAPVVAPLRGPVIEPARPAAVTAEPFVFEPEVEAVPPLEEAADAVEEALPEVAAVEEAPAPLTEQDTPTVDPANTSEWQTLLSQLGVETATSASPEAAAPEAEPTLVAEVPEEPAPAPPVEPPMWTKRVATPSPSAGRTYFFAQAVKGTTPSASGSAPARIQPPAASTPAAPKAPGASASAAASSSAPGPQSQPADAVEVDRPELESLNFPKDGLSRQWLDFLNQLSATK